MKVNVSPGKYIIAVSGGVDSMALLDILAKQVTGYRLQVTDKKASNLEPLTSNLSLVVAHFNHGIRKDAGQDEELVRNRAKELKLPFEVGYGRLGAKVSEETARNARYGFLRGVQIKYGAKAIITAHHRDDLIETALLNVLRGTGRKGLSSLSSGEEIIRPLLKWPKKDIVSYAKAKKLRWREDSTNENTDYLRNYLRHMVIPKLTPKQRKILISNLDKVAKLNISIDNKIATLSHTIYKNQSINRQLYASLPADVSSELLSYWLRADAIEFDRPTVSRLDVAIKTARPGTLQPVKGDNKMEFDQDFVLLRNRLGKVVNGLI